MLNSCNASVVLQDFPKVVASSFGLMALFYGMICALGYYYFGRVAADLVTVDLANNSIFTGHWVLLPAFTADKLVEACIPSQCIHHISPHSFGHPGV